VHVWVALALAAGTVAWMLAVEGRQGIGRDEAQYFRASERYWAWFETAATNLRKGTPRAALTRPVIDAHWGDNPEHPPLMKVLYGLSWRAFHRCECVGPERGLHPVAPPGRHITLGIFARESTAFRFPAILLAGLGAALVFLFARRLVGMPAAAAAAVLAVAQPHAFFHAQIAAFDAPITVMALVVAFAYWKSLRSRRWGLLCGPLWGLALATKHNAWMMPTFLLAHYLWMRRRDLWNPTRRRPGLPRPPLAFVSMATLGPLVFFACWPWLWPDPVGRTRGYLARHLQHEHYNFEYLGRNWNLPPRDLDLALLRTTFPFVSTLYTVPVTTLALAGLGGAALARAYAHRRRVEGLAAPVDKGTPASVAQGPPLPLASSPPDSSVWPGPLPLDDPPPEQRPTWMRPGIDVERAAGAFLALHVFGPMAVVALPATPIFGGIKHFLPAMPFLAIAAAIGLRGVALVVASALRSGRARRFTPAVLAVLVSAPALAETRRSHPDGLSHYNLLAGGFAGGASLGMNRQFWGYSVLPMLPWLVDQLPHPRNVYWHDVLHDAIVMYTRDGRLPAGVGNTGVGEDAIARSNLGLLIHEKHFALYEGVFWTNYGTTKPAYVRTREGVPLVTAYLRPGVTTP
jgi:hypothetical protein